MDSAGSHDELGVESRTKSRCLALSPVLRCTTDPPGCWRLPGGATDNHWSSRTFQSDFMCQGCVQSRGGSYPGGRQRPKFKRALADTSMWGKSAEIKAESFSSLNYHWKERWTLTVIHECVYFFSIDTNLFWKEWYISFPNSTFTFKKFRLQEKKKKVQRCIVITSIVKDISACDFEKSLAKIGHEKRKSVLVHNNNPSYMS